jgi:hypothetical protein
LQNTINLINDLLTAHSVVKPKEVVKAAVSLFRALMEEIIDLLNSVRPTLAPFVQAQIDAITGGLRRTVAALIHIISAQKSGLNIGNVGGTVTAIAIFCGNVCDDLIVALEEISNSSNPSF